MANRGFRESVACVGRRLKAFAAARRGNVAMIYALAMVPVIAAAGAGLDYARAVIVRSNLSDALDAAALAVGSTAGLSQSQMQTLAQQYFTANYNIDASFGTPGSLVVTPSGNSLTVSVTDRMPTTLLQVIGMNTLSVTASTKVVWGQTKLWVSLVLDNTGSMCEPDASPCPGDNNPNIKINALKTATTNLLALLKNAAVNAKDVMVAVVPFTTGVNVGTSNADASWLTYKPWDSQQNGSEGYGTYTKWGWPCTQGFTSGCQWTPTDADHSSWTGCVMDRDQDYDVSDRLPTAGNAPMQFPAAPAKLWFHSQWNITCPVKLLGLTDVLSSTGWNSLNNEVTNMAAGGSTNQTIGLAWGWMLMTSGSPIADPGSLPANTQRVIILLSDGLNTEDRWTGDGLHQDVGTDARMALACANAKADGITIYAVFVDLNGTQGNSSVLQSCASDISKYYDLTSAGQINGAFQAIGQQITNLHVAQ